jgi:small-conductance mechanosensitive channel
MPERSFLEVFLQALMSVALVLGLLLLISLLLVALFLLASLIRDGWRDLRRPRSGED